MTAYAVCYSKYCTDNRFKPVSAFGFINGKLRRQCKECNNRYSRECKRKQRLLRRLAAGHALRAVRGTTPPLPEPSPVPHPRPAIVTQQALSESVSSPAPMFESLSNIEVTLADVDITPATASEVAQLMADLGSFPM